MATSLRSISLVALICIASLATAQTGPQASQIPACVKACDPGAIASVGCESADQYCHCIRQDGILSNISACANSACTNPSADIYTFTTLFADVCEKFNISVPLLGSPEAGNGSTVTVPFGIGDGTAGNATAPRPSGGGGGGRPPLGPYEGGAADLGAGAAGAVRVVFGAVLAIWL